MKIVALDGHTLNPGDNPWDPVAALGDFSVYDKTSDELVLERAAGAQVILTNKVPLTQVVFDALPDLQFVSVTATGFNVVDTEAARARDIPFQAMVPNPPRKATRTGATARSSGRGFFGGGFWWRR